LVTTRDEHVRIRVHGNVGRLTLNRPEVLNALSHDMVRTLHLQLERWRGDSSVHVVVLDGEGGHGLSAGSDVRELLDDVHGASRLVALWRDEARLTATIARFPKPVVAFMDGIVMGSGLGLAAHASHRVLEPDSVVAMPEIGIGLVPSWGTTALFARAPGRVGIHLALTGDRMDAADALYCGFADFCLSRRDRSTLLAALVDTTVDGALDLPAAALPESELLGQRSWIDACYSADRVEDVVQLLSASGNTQASMAAARLSELSPTALKVVFQALRAARSDTSVEESLRREFRVATRLVVGPDVHEGIRAMVIDRDRVPTWVPGTLEAVTSEEADAYFASLGPHELDFPDASQRS
jgi:enoyl-CoA hydratase